MRRFACLLLGLLALAPTPALASDLEEPPRLGEPVGEIRFAADPGPWAARYLRALELKVGDRPTRDELERAALRLAAWPELEHVEVKRKGPVLTLELAEAPVIGFMVVPVPYLWQVAAGVSVDEWRFGPVFLNGKVQGSYYWDTLMVYDPRTSQRVGPLYPNNAFYGGLRLGATVAPDLQVLLRSYAVASALPDLSSTYDPLAPTRGLALTVGPEVHYDNSDSPVFPRLGTRVRVYSMLGTSGGGLGEFAVHGGEYQRYSPLGEGAAIVTSVSAGLNKGNVPWNFKLDAGSSCLRGYPARRFLGDQLLVGTLEVRKRLGAEVYARTALQALGLDSAMASKVGLYGAGFLDVGRAWDSRFGLSFPQGMRPAVGAYLGFSLGRWNVGRLEVGFGDEGPNAALVAGVPFDW